MENSNGAGQHPNLVVGISRSGKSTLAQALGEHYGCPVIGNDRHFIGGLTEEDATVMPYDFKHWECAVSCDLQGFYEKLRSLASEPNGPRLVIAEGHLLYNRQDVVNLLDVRIMRTMTKDGERARLKVLRPGLVKNEAWYSKVMWDQYFRQNALFTPALDRSHEISGELDPDAVFKSVVQLIDLYRIKHAAGLIPRPQPLPAPAQFPSDIKCCVCNNHSVNIKAPDGNDVAETRMLRHSCGHLFHRTCLRKRYDTFMETALRLRRKVPTIQPLTCPACSAPIGEQWIEDMGCLHDYKKATQGREECYKCSSCGRLHWACEGVRIVSYQCTGCRMLNYVLG